jgi:hypothetical protein
MVDEEKRTRSRVKAKEVSDKRKETPVVIEVAGDETMPSEDEQGVILSNVAIELQKSEQDLSDKLNDFDKIKKAYLNMETNSDPFYVDCNLLFSNVDLMMSLAFQNEMKVVFTGANEADMVNADIITKTLDYDYREEMDMQTNEYLG